jgi:phage tail-like protein
MADDRYGEQGGRLPPASGFSVQFGDGLSGTFAEVSGLTADGDAVDYREGQVTLRHGIFVGAAELLKILREVAVDLIDPSKRQVTIGLLDPNGRPAMTWTLNNAWPTKFTGPELNAEGNEIAIEELVLAHEGLELIKVS